MRYTGREFGVGIPGRNGVYTEREKMEYSRSV